MIINAENQIVGRIAVFAAKKALLGESVDILNCEKAIITGNKTEILAKYKRKRNLGVPLQGPYFPRKSEMIVKRIIRGMLPYKQYKGRSAFERIRCYSGVPSKFKINSAETVPGADVSKVPNLKYIKIETISKELGK